MSSSTVGMGVPAQITLHEKVGRLGTGAGARWSDCGRRAEDLDDFLHEP